MKAGIALGSNLGDRRAHFQKARDAILVLEGVAPPILQSPIYETAPIDCEPGAGNFYNAVIEIEFAKSSDALMRSLQEIERALGRKMGTRRGESLRARHVSRTIDLDLLYFGNERRADGELHLPHPRMTGREFVLRPLANIAPELRLPGETASVRELLARIPASGSVKCVTRNW